jgi:hypothetical protein
LLSGTSKKLSSDQSITNHWSGQNYDALLPIMFDSLPLNSTVRQNSAIADLVGALMKFNAPYLLQVLSVRLSKLE